MSYSKHKTEFIVKIDSTEWNSERSLPVSQSAGQVGTEATFDVSYEPTSLGTKSTIMTISSPSGGDYTFPLIGKCLAPNPQGEFRTRDRRIKTGRSQNRTRTIFLCVCFTNYFRTIYDQIKGFSNDSVQKYFQQTN